MGKVHQSGFGGCAETDGEECPHAGLLTGGTVEYLDLQAVLLGELTSIGDHRLRIDDVARLVDEISADILSCRDHRASLDGSSEQRSVQPPLVVQVEFARSLAAVLRFLVMVEAVCAPLKPLAESLG